MQEQDARPYTISIRLVALDIKWVDLQTDLDIVQLSIARSIDHLQINT
jgi:hypothetical protein